MAAAEAAGGAVGEGPGEGLATTATSAPIPVTRPNAATFPSSSIASSWSGRSTWIGVKNAMYRPSMAVVMPPIQTRPTLRTGSASAASGAVSASGAGGAVVIAAARR
nr:hypothetical protein GCM10025732_39090 [Glycomyces mayteni]